MAKKKTHGGARKNSGRKPIKDEKDKVIPVTLYFKQNKVEEIGLDNLKQKCYELFDIVK